MATPEEIEAMRAAINGPQEPSKFDAALSRVRDSGLRLAENPAMQMLQGVGNPMSGLMHSAGNYAVNKLHIGQRSPTEFTREMEGGPQPLDLKPMASGPEPVLPNTPTLAAGYGTGAAQHGRTGGPGGMSAMGGLAGAYRGAQENQFRSFNNEQDLVERRGELVAERTDKMAELQELDAARKQRDAEVKGQYDAQIAQKHEVFLARNQELADQIGAEKIDPAKVIGDMGVGQKLGLLIAGALSGAAGQGQQFLSRLDTMVDQGVKAQMANADNKKAKLSARQSVFDRMMAETGDRRVAEQQTRALIYESVKQKMGADAERLGIPEVLNNAELTRNAIDETKINPLRVQMTGEALRAAQQQAAAAAAAQRQAEDRAWERGMKIAELGLKQDAQKIEMAKLEGKDKDDINAETAKLGAALSDPKLAAGRAAVENSKRRLGIADDGTVVLDRDGKPVVDQKEGLPGVGAMGDFREKYAAKPTGAQVINPLSWALNKTIGLNDEERVSRGDLEKMALAYQNQVTGAGGSVEEQAKIRKAFLGANTPAEQRAAVSEADAVFRQIEARNKAGVSPKALATYEARLKGEMPTLPNSVRVKR